MTMVPCDLGVAPLGSAVFRSDNVARVGQDVAREGWNSARVGRNVARVGRNVARVGWSLVDLCRARDVNFWGCANPARVGRGSNFLANFCGNGPCCGLDFVALLAGCTIPRLVNFQLLPCDACLV